MQAAVGWASWDILSSDPVTSLEKLASLPLITSIVEAQVLTTNLPEKNFEGNYLC